MHTYSFEKLETWQRARLFRKEIYLLVAKFPKEEMFGLTSQLKRSSSTIGDCIAEGSGRITAKDKAHYLTMSYALQLKPSITLSEPLTWDLLTKKNILHSDLSLMK